MHLRLIFSLILFVIHSKALDLLKTPLDRPCSQEVAVLHTTDKTVLMIFSKECIQFTFLERMHVYLFSILNICNQKTHSVMDSKNYC